MCCVTKRIVNVELVKTTIVHHHSLSITPKASKAVSCFGCSCSGVRKNLVQENRTTRAPSWGIPILKAFILLCAEQ